VAQIAATGSASFFAFLAVLRSCPRIGFSGWRKRTGPTQRDAQFAGMLLLVFPRPSLSYCLWKLFMWDWRHVLLHGAFQLMTGALLIEAMFWTFDKVPFTCSYLPGNISLSLLAGLYLHGFTTTAFIWQISNVRWTEMWLFRRPSRAARFDAEEPEIRALDVT